MNNAGRRGGLKHAQAVGEDALGPRHLSSNHAMGGKGDSAYHPCQGRAVGVGGLGGGSHRDGRSGEEGHGRVVQPEGEHGSGHDHAQMLRRAVRTGGVMAEGSPAEEKAESPAEERAEQRSSGYGSVQERWHAGAGKGKV